LNLRKVILAATAATLALTLTACDQVPSLEARDQAANKKACDSISSTWNSVSTALASGNVVSIGQAVQNVPQQVDQALSLATDNQLTFNLTSLKVQAQSVISGAQPDISALAGIGIGISARCALLGSTANIQLPKF
jgi:starvation-inducible outer membrane lipoprotein